MKLEATFALERETKGALRFQETSKDGQPLTIDKGAKIGTLYIRKSALDGQAPARLTVTIQAE